MESLHTAPRNGRQTKSKVSSSSLRYARQFLRSSHGARDDEGAVIVFVEGYLRALWWMVFELLLERYLDRGRSWRRPKTSAWSGGRPNGLSTKIYCLYALARPHGWYEVIKVLNWCLSKRHSTWNHQNWHGRSWEIKQNMGAICVKNKKTE